MIKIIVNNMKSGWLTLGQLERLIKEYKENGKEVEITISTK
jgi:hypothetical protein